MVRRTPEDWRQLLTAHQQSGKTAAAFCREQGLCPRYFSKRRKELLDPLLVPVPRAFVPVTLTRPTQADRVELQLGDAFILQLLTSVSPAWLAELAHHLRG